MTDNTGPVQYHSRSWILGRVSFNCTSQRAIDPFISRGQSGGSRRVASQQGFDPPPTCFAVSLLSPAREDDRPFLPLTTAPVSCASSSFGTLSMYLPLIAISRFPLNVSFLSVLTPGNWSSPLLLFGALEFRVLII